jgi:hypothetical protein
LSHFNIYVRRELSCDLRVGTVLNDVDDEGEDADPFDILGALVIDEIYKEVVGVFSDRC